MRWRVTRNLKYDNSNVWHTYNSTKNFMITSNSEVHGLWKSVENERKPWRACSGCAGDYEDPDRSAWEEEFEEEEEEGAGDEPGNGE